MFNGIKQFPFMTDEESQFFEDKLEIIFSTLNGLSNEDAKMLLDRVFSAMERKFNSSIFSY